MDWNKKHDCENVTRTVRQKQLNCFLSDKLLSCHTASIRQKNKNKKVTSTSQYIH